MKLAASGLAALCAGVGRWAASRGALTSLLVTAAALAAPLAAASTAPSGASDSAPPAPSKPAVAVSVPPQAWLLERLAGDAVEVVTVVAPGMDHETYQATDQQASAVMRAKLYFAVGLPLERGRWFEAIRSSGRVRIVDCREGIAARTLQGHSHDHGHEHDHHDGDAKGHAAHDGGAAATCSLDGNDPHIWTAPGALKRQAQTMAKALGEAMPDHAETFARRLRDLEAELDALDQELRRLLEPCRGRSFFVFHPAWGYFADEYGLRQVAIERQGKPPSDQELTELQRQARKEGIRVVFVQPQISGKAAAAVATAVGGRVETIDPLAPDVPRNLRRVAEAIAEACR